MGALCKIERVNSQKHIALSCHMIASQFQEGSSRVVRLKASNKDEILLTFLRRHLRSFSEF